MLSASRFASRFLENQSARRTFSTLLKNVSSYPTEINNTIVHIDFIITLFEANRAILIGFFFAFQCVKIRKKMQFRAVNAILPAPYIHKMQLLHLLNAFDWLR